MYVSRTHLPFYVLLRLCSVHCALFVLRFLTCCCVSQVYVEMGYNLPDTQLRVYKQDLETRLIEHAGQHYKRVARSWLDQDSCPNYLQKAEAHLHDEDSRVEDYLNQSTLEPLRREVYIRLLKEHQSELLQKGTGVRHMLANNRRDGEVPAKEVLVCV